MRLFPALLLTLILTLGLVACDPGPQPVATPTPNPTAVYGANQFHAQLTAIARQSIP